MEVFNDICFAIEFTFSVKFYFFIKTHKVNVDGVYNFIIPSGFQIRVSYYSGGVEAQFFVFDAVGANKTGWFSRHRLLETSYDITAFANTIGIFGEYFSLEE